MLRIVVTSGPEKGRSLDSRDLTEIEIGRQARHLRLTDGRVSRVHCNIQQNDAGEWFIADCNSKRGTMHNGRLVTGRARIVDGDMITLGHSVIRCFISVPMKVTEDPRKPVQSKAGAAARAKSTSNQPTIQTTATQSPKPVAKRSAPAQPAAPAPRAEPKRVAASKPKPVERAKQAPQPEITPVSAASKNGEEAASCWMDAITSEMQAFDENEYDDESLG